MGLDPAALAQLRRTVGDDPAILDELIDAFLEDAPALLTDIQRAVEFSDGPQLRLAAQSLESNSATFGAMALAQLSAQLEAMGKEARFNGAPELADQIQQTYSGVVEALGGLRQTPSVAGVEQG